MDKEEKKNGLQQDAKQNRKDKKATKWGGLLNEFLWWCAGVDKKILRQCPTDWAKYAGQGGLIFFTALMAMLSGGYAFFFIFSSVPLAIAFGVFWGSLIFNLDRFIVNTMYSDGKYTISWGEIGAGLPRLIIAVFIGIVISTPLELKIFEDRIASQIVKDNIERVNSIRNSGDKGNKALIDRRNALEKEKNELESLLREAKRRLSDEVEGTVGTGVKGHGPAAAEKEAEKDAIEEQLKDWHMMHDAELESLIKQINTNTSKVNDNAKLVSENNGFCVRYEAFNNIKSQSSTMSIVSFFITLLFIIIEVCPTIFKMMIASGPYDCLLDAERHNKKVTSMKIISDINDEINTEIQISTRKNKARIEQQIKNNNELMEQISAVQSEILSKAIAAWREEEMKKVLDNPSAYIKSNKPS